MGGRGRNFRRWYQDHQARVTDLLVLLLVCSGSGMALLLLDGSAMVLPRLGAGMPVYKGMLWLVVLVLSLSIYAWRRWAEISSLLEDAETDVLTGLNNRRKMELLLAHEFDRALRYGRPLSVVMMDVDHFKRVNDSYGHAIGDWVLTAIARRVKRRMRISDHFGRWGGEEFLLVCPETDTEGATKIANRMRRTVKQRPMQQAGTVTMSFGVSSYAGQGDYDSLIEEADAYLYMAKQQGRDRVMTRLMAMDQLRTGGDGSVFLQFTRKTEETSNSVLSTMMSTIAAPLRRDRRKR